MSTAIGAGISGVFGEKPGSGVSAYDNIYSVHFDSPAQRINCGDSSSFSFPGTVASDRAFSISTWVYFVDTVNSVQICGKGDVGTADAEYNLETDSAGRVRIRLYDSNVSSTSTSYWQGRNDTVLETNKWYHIVATFDGTTPNAQSNSIRIYVNNQLNNVVTRVNTPGPFVQMFDNGGKFILGTTDGVNSKNIYMDEAAIFNRALTQADINYLYSIPFTPNLTVNGNFTELGSELILNGDFEELGDNVLTSTWSTGSGWSLITDGVSCDGSVSGGNVVNNVELTDYNGKTFLLTYTLSNVTDSSTLRYKFGGGSLVVINGTEGTHSLYITNDATVDNFQFVSSTGWAGDVTNISLKQVDPNSRWNLGAGWSIEDGELKANSPGGTKATAQVVDGFTAGKVYKLNFDVATVTQGYFRAYAYVGSSGTFTNILTTPLLQTGPYETLFKFGGTDKTFRFYGHPNPGPFTIGSIDNASIKEISGWTFGDGWTVNSSNQAEYDGTGTTASALEQTVATYEDGKKYQVQFQLDGSLNGVAVSINGGTAVNALRSTTDNSSRSVTVIAGSGSNSLKITPLGATDTFTIYDITSKLVTSLAAPNTDKDDARAVDLTGMSDLDHWWRMGDTQGPATYPVIHDVVYNPFGDQLVENGNFDELGPQLIQNPLFGLGLELVRNGDFATDSDWSKAAGWSIANGRAIHDGLSSYKKISQLITTEVGKTYRYEVTVSDLTTHQVYLMARQNNEFGTYYFNNIKTENGTYVFYFTALTTLTAIVFQNGNNNAVSIDNASVKEVPHWTVVDSDTNNYVDFTGGLARLKFLNTSPITKLETSTQILQANKTYKLVVDVHDVTSGEIKIDGVGIQEYFNTEGVTTRYITPTGNTPLRFYRNSANVDITLASVSVQQVDPNSDWSFIGTTEISGGIASFPDNTNSFLIQNFVVDLSVKNYKLTYEVVSTNGSNFRLAGGNSAFGTVTLDSSTIGTKTAYLTSNGTKQNLQFNNNNFVGSIDNVSVQQVSDTSGIMENMNPDNIVAFSPPDPDPLVGDEFIFSVNTAQSGVSNSDQFQLPLISAGTLDFTVIWGDGTQDIITSYNQAETLHAYPSSGTYTIGIRANTEPLKGFKFDSGGDKLKMSNIVNWGGSNFRLDQQEAFYGCSNMTCTATDAPLITATVFYRMFRGCSNFNGDLSNWDVSDVTSFAQMFYSCNAFTGKGLENWDISSANRIDYMFFNCPVFNGQIGGWDTSGVTNMGYVFQQCSIFNQDISSWDTSLVTRMNNMFQDAFEFNQPLNSWDVSSCVEFASMFKNATEFNQPLNNWTIKNDAEVDMNAMFFNANRFNQDVSMWDVSRVRFMQYMFYSCADMSFGFDGWDTSSVDNFYRFAGDTNVLDTSFGYLDISSALQLTFFKSSGQTISTENYNNTLIGWAAQTVNPNLTTSFGNATYSYSAFDARNTLTSAPNNWTITDGGYVPTDNAFQFTVNPNLQTLGNEEINIAGGTPQQAGDWANATATSVDFTGTSGGGTTYYDGIESGLTNGSTYKLTLTISNFSGTSDLGFSGAGGVPSTARLGSDNTITVYFVSNGAPLRLFGRAGTNSGTMTVSVKEVLSDTNQFELPLINQGTQDFVVDWGDGEQDKITAWDDAAKLHSYYTYGSELVTNGDFATNSDWNLANGWNIDTSEQTLNFTNVSGYVYQGISTQQDKTYKVVVDVDLTSGSLRVTSFNSQIVIEVNTTGRQTLTGYFTEVDANQNFGFVPVGSSVSGKIHSVSVVEQIPDTTPKTISIDGTIQGWKFSTPGDYLKLNNINRWGALDIHSSAMFYRCANMTCTATDAPTVSTTSFYRMFRNCTNFNGAIGNWDVSGVTRMDEFLKECTNFNQPLNNWDVSSVNNFAQMFNGCTNFVQDLNDWQINNSEIVNMYAMFYNCPNFNGDIYSWDTSKVWNMALMFYNCDSFDQSLAAWNIEGVTNFGDVNLGFMRLATGLSTSNYNLTLVSWAHQNVNSGLSLDFGGSQYSAGGAAEASRNILTSAPNNWAISDGGSV